MPKPDLPSTNTWAPIELPQILGPTIFKDAVFDPLNPVPDLSGVDVTAGLEGILGNQLQQALVENPNLDYEQFYSDYYTQLNSQLPELVQPTTPTTPTLEQEIQSWFAANPDATAQEVFDAMQQNNVQPQAVIDAMGLDPEQAMAQYNTFLNPDDSQGETPTTPTDPDPADPGMGVGDVVQSAAEKIDQVLSGVGDIFNLPTSQVVLNSPTGGGTVTWGTPSGTYTPVVIGHLPTSGAPVAATTGIPALDAILNKVFSKVGGMGQTGGGSWVDIIQGAVEDEVLAEVGRSTGLPVEDILGAASGSLEDVLAQVGNIAGDVASKMESEGVLPGPAPITDEPVTDVDNPWGPIDNDGNPVEGPKQETPTTPGGEDDNEIPTTPGGEDDNEIPTTPGGTDGNDPTEDLFEPDPEELANIISGISALSGNALRGVSVETPEPGELDYIYDFESIFANPHQAAQMVSPTGQERVEESDLLEYLMRNLQGGQSIEDLLEEIRRR